jgi:hypothetical protein
MLPATANGDMPHHSRHQTTCNEPDPVGVVDGTVDKGRRWGLDSEFRSGDVLDDATTNATDQMDPRCILRGRCPQRRAVSPGAGRRRQQREGGYGVT